jgi:hypothetical protein
MKGDQNEENIIETQQSKRTSSCQAMLCLSLVGLGCIYSQEIN